MDGLWHTCYTGRNSNKQYCNSWWSPIFFFHLL